jgi:peptidoglycan/LPS O-acetylase OafA/YrhL
MHFRILDSWRGAAALMVALFHLNVLSPLYTLDFIRNAYLFVDFFFVLSGFVITHSYGEKLATLDGVGIFAFRRFMRLWPLHATVLVAFVLVESAKAVAVRHGIGFDTPPFTGAMSAATVPLNLVFGHAIGFTNQLTWNAPSWSIAAEFWTYLIFASAVHFGATRLWRYRLAEEILIAIILMASIAALVTGSKHGQDVTYDLGLIRCLYGFLVGHFVYRLWQVCPRAVFDRPVIEIAVLMGTVGYVSLAAHSTYSFFAPLVFAVVVLVFAYETGPVSVLMSNRCCEWLGRISYSIYMWQAFLIHNLIDRPVSVIEKLTHRVLTSTDVAGSALGGDAGKLIVLGGHFLPLLLTLAFLAALVVVASLSYRLIEQPAQAWGRNIALGRKRDKIEAPNPM